jgi:hypothetical protein
MRPVFKFLRCSYDFIKQKVYFSLLMQVHVGLIMLAACTILSPCFLASYLVTKPTPPILCYKELVAEVRDHIVMLYQGFGSGLDPDSVRWAKMTHKSRKN